MYRRSDGSLSFKGQLDPILGTTVFNALNTEHDKVEQRQVDNHDDANELSRSRCSRRGQARANLVAKGAQRADGTIGAPLINVVMSQQVAEDLLAGETATTDPFDIDKRCEFIDGTPLHPALAKKLLMDRTVFRRIVMSAKSIRLDVSVTARLFPRWMKDVALVTTRGRCSEPGCDAPSHWIEADHIHPHSRNGPTSLNNIQPLCRQGNKAKSDRIDSGSVDPPGERPDQPPNEPPDEPGQPDESDRPDRPAA